MGAGTVSLNVTITPVDETRTVVFSSSQAFGTQGGGEALLSGGNDGQNASARLVLQPGGTVVKMQHELTNAAATFTLYVVEIDP
jgi:hypothetical protein